MNVERSKLLPLNIGKSDANKAIFKERQKVGASLADVSPMEMDVNVTFESVGGLDEHVNSLKEMVMFPLLYKEIFSKFNIGAPKGVLFYGPPGTGKTLVARALACECSHDNRKVAFFMRKGADCLSKWIGESERQLRLLFDQAYLYRPSIIFFDEIDGLAPVRSSRQDQIHSSIVSTLLALMDGLDDRGEIIVIGATNRIENIDPALRRPGRFDRELRFALPTQAARKDILTLHTKKWEPAVNADMLETLSQKTIGYSGADLKGLCSEAVLNGLRRRYPQIYRTNQKLALDLQQVSINEEDFFKAMETTIPSTHRIEDQSQWPLAPEIRPLLHATVAELCNRIRQIMPNKRAAAIASSSTAMCCSSKLQSEIKHSYRPRLLVSGKRGQGLTTYIGPAILHTFETLPCHKLDVTSLSSNAARSPEEALIHVVREARRTAPAILYIPHMTKLWRSVMQRELLLSLLTDVPPTAPLLVLAIAEEPEKDEQEEMIEEVFGSAADEVFRVENPSAEERQLYFQPVFEAAVKLPPTDTADSLQKSKSTSEVAAAEAEVLNVVPLADTRALSEKEEKRLKRKEDALLRELRIFLRDIWQKINKDPKFFMFRVPVDTEEVYDYLDIIEKPMDFDQMLQKLDCNSYNCAQDFLDDIDLIADNAIKYNSDMNYETNKVICHRAHALKDFAYALVKAEMDTDFEDDCKDIVARRKKITERLKQEPAKPTTAVASSSSNAAASAASAGIVLPNGQAEENEQQQRRPAKRRRTSNWSKGVTPRRRAAAAANKRPADDDDEMEDEMEGGEEAEDDAVITAEASVDASRNQVPAATAAEKDIPKETAAAAAAAAATTTADAAETDSRQPEQEKQQPLSQAASVLVIDRKGLDDLKKKVMSKTRDMTVESLERLYWKMMKIVQSYRHEFDRSDLIQDLRSVQELT